MPKSATKLKDPTEALGPDLTGGDNAQSVATARLRDFIGRIETLEDDRKAVSDDIKEVYAEAKADGWDTKIMRRVVSLRRRSREEVEEEQTLIDIYMHALGMIPQDEDTEELV